MADSIADHILYREVGSSARPLQLHASIPTWALECQSVQSQWPSVTVELDGSTRSVMEPTETGSPG